MRWLSYFSLFIFCANLTLAQDDTEFHSISEKGAKHGSKIESGEVFKPKVALGAGMLSFYGDLYSRHYQTPWVSRIGYDLNVSHRLTRYLQVNFNVMFGKLGAFENTT